ncbi:prephenate dehydrogenase/arogenate dehydrogenase family protein [Vulcanisaeta souniana]|uniref:prephenate dehydrogenase/arogenate dehydrogenase family protein n=1 Tax=Vulcanisaeta souniana TaxID=164452 RepID=UPI001FB43B72|nr:prephenate dehydrogenase/arogenate dehydrogenase family protein [Vulcanisaeta souniana]
MLATRPTPDSLDIITKYSGRFRGGSVVMDLFSVKAPMFRLIESESLRAGFHYISAHPLFGELGNPIGETVVLIPSKSGSDRIDMTRELFTDAGFKVVVLSSPEEHDRLMAYIQVAHHILLLTLYRAMKRAGLDLDTPLATHSLKYTLKALERILEQPEVSNELFRLNPYSRSVAEELGDLLKEVVKGGLNGTMLLGGCWYMIIKASKDRANDIASLLDKAKVKLNIVRIYDEELIVTWPDSKVDANAVKSVDPNAVVIEIKTKYQLVSNAWRYGTIVDVDGVRIGGNDVIVAAGPCAVEGYEQVRDTAIALRKQAPNYSGAVRLSQGLIHTASRGLVLRVLRYLGGSGMRLVCQWSLR